MKHRISRLHPISIPGAMNGVMIGALALSLLLAFAPCSSAQTDVTDQTDLVESSTRYDRRTGMFSFSVSVKNISDNPLAAPIKVVIVSISSPDVTVANPDGTDQDMPYFLYEDEIAGGQLDSGEMSASKRWVFSNPTRVRFTYEAQVWAGMGPVTSTVVPNVVGLSVAAALSAITGANLIVGTITMENSDTVPEGSVISQDPPAGTSVAQGSPVDLVFSLGPTDSAPTLSNLVAPATVPFGDTAVITFDYADPDGDIVSVETTQSNVFGDIAGSIPADMLDIVGTSGQVSLPVNANAFSFGDTAFTLQLRDSGDRLSNVISFILTVVGEATGGTAPSLQSFSVLTTPWNLPTGAIDRLKPLFSFGYNDPDGDIFRVRKRIIKPTGEQVVSEDSALSHMIEGVDGVVEKPFITFRSTDTLGTYTIELTLIDRNGNLSNTEAASVELVDSGGNVPPFISDFTPQQGAAGTEVTLMGGGFDTETLESNQVELTEVPAAVVDVTNSTLTLIIPEGASSGPFVVRNKSGAAASEALFIVPTSVTVSPEGPEVVIGGFLQFEAIVISAASDEVMWSVSGIPGGDATFGTITADGLYAAPGDIPPGGAVTVSATLVSDPGILAGTPVTILPPPSTPGRAIVLASVGGTVRSIDGSAQVEIPAGALPFTTEVSVTVLRGAAVPPPPADQRVVGAVDLGPPGLVFASSAMLTLPLVRYYPPGTELPLLFFDPATGTYQDEGIPAIVADNGEQASAEIGHFSTAAVSDLLRDMYINPPSISGITPAQGQEGLKVPVIITGSFLDLNLEPEVLLGGSPTLDIIPGAWYALGETGALLLNIQTIRDLPAGSTRSYTVRLTRRDGATAETTFSVSGLDELDVGPAEVRQDTPAGTYSEINVQGRMEVSDDAPSFGFESTGPVEITGTISAQGRSGEDGIGLRCGGLLPGEDEDDCGRVGLRNGRGGLGRDSDDDPEGKHYGGDAAYAFGRNGGNPRGVGGDPGKNIRMDLGLTDVIRAVVDCVGFFIGDDDDPKPCASVATSLVASASMVADLIESPTGRRGFGAARGAGGGGGGGGGRLESPKVGISIPVLDIGLVVSFAITGGGGGAGGQRGLGLSIVSPDPIHLGTGGRITAAGGTGGNGSSEGSLQLRLHVPFIGFLLPDISVGLPIDGLPAITGGGGGGGSGGALKLVSGTQISFANSISHGTPSNQLNVDGGKGGMGGKTLIEEEHGNTTTVIEDNAASDGLRGTRTICDPSQPCNTPIFDPTSIDDMVTNRSLLTARVKASGTDPLTICIEGEGTQFREVETVLNGGFYTADLVLFQGLNTVYVDGMPELLRKHVASVFTDTDGDGLSDADELALGTDHRNADTDGDGLADGDEILNRANPLDADSDDDGLPDGAEVDIYLTDPINPDSDGDGFSDGAESLLGSSPTLDTSMPTEIPAGILLAQAGGYLAVVDPTTGFFGPLGQPNGGFGFGLACDCAATLFIAQGSRLATHDPITGATTDVAAFEDSSGSPISIIEIAYNPGDGMLYGVEEGPAPDFLPTGQLVQIDPNTAEAARMGSPGAVAIHALTFTRDGVLYAAVEGDTTSDRFVEMDPDNGTIIQDIGDIGFTPVFGMAITRRDPVTGADSLFASNRLSNNKSQILIIIDRTNGQGTLRSTANQAVFGLTIMPCAAPCLEPAPGSPFSVSMLPSFLAIADLNNDLFLDVVTANMSDNVSVLLGNGDGTLQPEQSFGVGGEPSSVAVANVNVNIDSYPDLVTVNSGTEDISVLLGNGDGTFQPEQRFPVGGSLSGIAAGDLDGDGNPDVVTAVTTFDLGPPIWVWTSGVILLGDGNGNFTRAPDILLSSFAYVGSMAMGHSVAISDLNGDGYPDIVFETESSRKLHVFLGDGAGNFVPGPALAVGGAKTASIAMSIGDLNGDTSPDLVAGTWDTDGVPGYDPGYGLVRVFLGDGSGGFTPHAPFREGGSGFISIAVGNLDCGNDMDVATGRFWNSTALLGDGSGGFTRVAPIPAFSQTFIALGDLNGDGWVDVAMTDLEASAVIVLLNNSPF